MTAGVVWMIGLMDLIGMQLTVINVTVLPMIFGIDIDNGVHIVHHCHIEGSKKYSKYLPVPEKLSF